MEQVRGDDFTQLGKFLFVGQIFGEKCVEFVDEIRPQTFDQRRAERANCSKRGQRVEMTDDLKNGENVDWDVVPRDDFS